MATQRSGLVVMATLLLAGACEADEVTLEEVTLRGLESNGFQLNGFQLNGFQLNGFQLNGFQLNGERLYGAPGTADFIEISDIYVKGDKGDGSWLVGSSLAMKGKTGVVWSGLDLVGARIDFTMNEGTKGVHIKSARVAGVEPLAPGSDVMVYALELNDGGWKPLCEGGAKAILLGDLWDPASGDRITDPSDGALTFACRGAALAKCVEYGYRPWASAGGVSLREYHQACTRMVRADYCGDGQPHTTNGTAIHVLDPIGVQKADPNVNYVVEAEWGPDGATCLNGENTRQANQSISCTIPMCKKSFASGGLIQSGKVLSGS